jgi:hypothetical protein
MSEELIPSSETPSVDEIKARLASEIPVEDEPMASATGEPELADELRKVGRQFAETLKAAWTSEERVKIEQEVREGVKSFADEVEKVFHEVRKSQAAQRVKGKRRRLRAAPRAASWRTRRGSTSPRGCAG